MSKALVLLEKHTKNAAEKSHLLGLREIEMSRGLVFIPKFSRDLFIISLP